MTHQRFNLLAAASMIAIATHASAQTAAPASGVEDIVVTAQSREQRQQKVPISMLAFDSKFIKKTNARTIADLQRFTPGLTVDNTSVTQPVFTIRGVTGGTFGIGTDPAVGIYIDGVYSARSGESLIFFDDLERIEILKGPQGTLFGRNTAAGAISVVTKKPTQKLEGTIDYTYGNYDKNEAKLILNIPLTDNFAVRLDGIINRRDGWLDNYNGAKLDNEHNDSGRLSARWTPTQDDEIIFAWDHDSTSVAPPTALPLLVYPVDSTSLFNGVPVNPYSSVHDAEINGHESRMLDGLTLTEKHDFGGVSLTSITAYKNFHSQNLESETGSSNFNRYFDTDNIETNHNFYQEFRVNGVWDNLTYVAGASFFYERAKQESVATTSTQSADIAFGAPLFQFVSTLSGINVMNDHYQEQMNNLGQNKAWSVFGDATYALTPQVNLTAGLRATGDDKDFQWNSPLGVVLGAPQAASLETQTLLKLFNNGNAIFNTYPVPQGTPYSRQISSTNASPRFVADYQFAQSAMVYASASYGYKAGGFNSVEINSTFKPEYVSSYEVGVKSDWFDHRLRFNSSAYYYTYENQQAITLVHVPGALVPEYITQVGNSTGKGVDAELHAIPIDNLTLNLTTGYIDSTWDKRIVDETGDTGTTIPLNLAGQPTGEPEFRVVTGGDYKLDLQEKGNLLFFISNSFTTHERQNADTRFQNALARDYGANLNLLPGYQRSLDITDARITWTDKTAHYEIAAFANNLFDRRQVTDLNNITETQLGTPYTRPYGDPRFYGVEAAYHF